MYKFFKQSKSATPGQSPQSPPQPTTHSLDPRMAGSVASAGSSPGTTLKYTTEPLQSDPSMEEILMDQINLLKKSIQDKEFEHMRRVETLIEALAEKAEENIQILNELESLKAKVKCADDDGTRSTGEHSSSSTANTTPINGALMSPQIIGVNGPSPLIKPAEAPLSKELSITISDDNESDTKNTISTSGDLSEHDKDAELKRLRKELEAERKKRKELEKKVASLESKLKDKSKKRDGDKQNKDPDSEDDRWVLVNDDDERSGEKK